MDLVKDPVFASQGLGSFQCDCRSAAAMVQQQILESRVGTKQLSSGKQNEPGMTA